MGENDLVVLDDNKSFVLLKEIYDADNDTTYFLASEYVNDNLNVNNSLFFKVVKENGEDYLEDVVNVADIRHLLGASLVEEVVNKFPQMEPVFDKVFNVE